MANQLDIFEEKVKEAVADFEVDFNPNHWNELNNRLDIQQPNNNPYQHLDKWALGIASVLVVAFTLSYNINSNEENGVEIVFEQNDHKTIPSETNNTINKNNTQTLIENKETISTIIDTTKTNNNETENVEAAIAEVSTPTPTESKESKADRLVVNEQTELENKKSDNNQENFNLSQLVTLKVNKNKVCTNDIIRAEIVSDLEGLEIEWLNSNNPKNSKQGEFIFTNPGEYVIVSQITYKKETVRLNSEKLTVYTSPSADFFIEEPITKNSKESYHFIANEYNLNKYTWIVNNEKTAETSEHCSMPFTKKGKYEITLATTNTHGCVSKNTQTIFVDSDYNLRAPNSFTPNGDSRNDYWIPEDLKNDDIQFNLMIYNQAGKLIFQSNHYNNQWDGTLPNGGKAKPLEVYFWQAVYTDSNDVKSTAKGSITIAN